MEQVCNLPSARAVQSRLIHFPSDGRIVVLAARPPPLRRFQPRSPNPIATKGSARATAALYADSDELLLSETILVVKRRSSISGGETLNLEVRGWLSPRTYEGDAGHNNLLLARLRVAVRGQGISRDSPCCFSLTGYKCAGYPHSFFRI